ncbi:hypothetical protein DL769_004047 [Monosporascus sp. CRB-8-3]|nr:hypothetical protein DL769_004047 [Monosporascus sp. CRB-8-3]
MATGKRIASGKNVGQPEDFNMEQLIKAFTTKKKDTYLDWTDLNFKLNEENRLRSSNNWKIWKTAIWVALMAVGYRNAPMAVVTGLIKGTEMIKLQFAKWDPKKQSALDHVVDFKNLVRRCNEVDIPVNAGQQVTMFINSIRDRNHDGDI